MNRLDKALTPVGLHCMWYAIGQRKHWTTAAAPPGSPQYAQQCRGQRKSLLPLQEVNGHLQQCQPASSCDAIAPLPEAAKLSLAAGEVGKQRASNVMRVGGSLCTSRGFLARLL